MPETAPIKIDPHYNSAHGIAVPVAGAMRFMAANGFDVLMISADGKNWLM
ncbi:MAG: hypothetical protein IPL50_12135 [Chitinophagaceae bacterium]|nr:hypothetical protein [Chitinophagaceae bacterium]